MENTNYKRIVGYEIEIDNEGNPFQWDSENYDNTDAAIDSDQIFELSDNGSEWIHKASDWREVVEILEKIIMSIKNLSLNFYDYENREDFISQMEIFYNENNWELPVGEDVGEYWDYNTATTEVN